MVTGVLYYNQKETKGDDKMEVIGKEQLAAIRENLAVNQGLKCGENVKCYHCKLWGYNRGKVMNSMGESRCAIRKERTASYQWCKKFETI